MIRRDIAEKPLEVLATFDFFNDLKDTRAWCKVNYPEILPLLDARAEVWNCEVQMGQLRRTIQDRENTIMNQEGKIRDLIDRLQRFVSAAIQPIDFSRPERRHFTIEFSPRILKGLSGGRCREAIINEIEIAKREVLRELGL